MLQNSSQLNKSKVMFCKCFSPKEYLHLRPPPSNHLNWLAGQWYVLLAYNYTVRHKVKLAPHLPSLLNHPPPLNASHINVWTYPFYIYSYGDGRT